MINIFTVDGKHVLNLPQFDSSDPSGQSLYRLHKALAGKHTPVVLHNFIPTRQDVMPVVLVMTLFYNVLQVLTCTSSIICLQR